MAEKETRYLAAIARQRATVVYRLEILEGLADSAAEEPTDAEQIVEGKARLEALDWATRIVRAALVVVEERTPDGVSDTLLDLLQKAAR